MRRIWRASSRSSGRGSEVAGTFRWFVVHPLLASSLRRTNLLVRRRSCGSPRAIAQCAGQQVIFRRRHLAPERDSGTQEVRQGRRQWEQGNRIHTRVSDIDRGAKEDLRLFARAVFACSVCDDAVAKSVCRNSRRRRATCRNWRSTRSRSRVSGANTASASLSSFP